MEQVERRIVEIVYADGGVTVYFKTPASEKRIVHQDKRTERIPSFISLYLDHAKINIIEKEDE